MQLSLGVMLELNRRNVVMSSRLVLDENCSYGAWEAESIIISSCWFRSSMVGLLKSTLENST